MSDSTLINDGGERMSYGEGKAIREPSTGKGRFDLVTPFGMMRLAKWYELGAQKYSDRNWEKGMPFSRYIDSAMRHIVKYIMGMRDEDHLAAAAWNILCIIHHEELGQTELDDLPHYISERGKVMPDEPTYTDWLPTIEPEEVGKASSQYGNRYVEITEEQIEELRAGKVLCYVDEYGIFIKLKKE